MKCYTLTIAGLRDRYNGQIELEPPYQRKPAWKTKQRLLLLSSLFNGIPIPALILHFIERHKIRHARFAGLFFDLGNELERRYSNLFVNKWKVNSKSDLERYILHEYWHWKIHWIA